MAIIQRAKRAVEKLTGTRIYRSMPRGMDIFHDIRVRLPSLEIHTIFDVGANVGQSALVYLEEFPDADIYCFEPVGETFRQLQRSLRNRRNVLTFRLALGAETGAGQMVVDEHSDLAFLRTSSNSTAADGARLESVSLETLAGFCHSRDIAHIDYLKIDTEGGDLDVLKGAAQLLDKQEIDMIEVEAGVNRRNLKHVPLDDFVQFFEPKCYFLFGVYDQVEEWPTNQRNLRRVNPVFISDRVIQANSSR
jgi:FkbM family methyltransferase